MAGLGGLNGWAWIFILEGILTVLFGKTIPPFFGSIYDSDKCDQLAYLTFSFRTIRVLPSS